MVSNVFILSVCLLCHIHVLAVRNGESEWIDADESTSKSPASPAVPPVSTANSNLTKSIVSMLTSFLEVKAGAASVSRPRNAVEDIATVLRFEFFTITTGDHFVFTKGDNVSEQTRHKYAAAASALWSDLFCMDDMDDILQNVSISVATQLVQSKTPDTQDEQKWLTLFVDNVRQAIAKDEFLDIMFLAEQIRFANALFKMDSPQRKTYVRVNSESETVVEETIAEWLMRPAIRKFLVNKLFLQHRFKPNRDAEGEQYERYVSTRAILSMAHSRCCMEPTQKIYTQIVAEVADSFVVADYPQLTIRQLYSKLEKTLNGDAKLKPAFEKAKKKLTERSSEPKKRTSKVL